MVDHGQNGYLIDISKYNLEQLFKGCVVREVPKDLKNYITEQPCEYMYSLIESMKLRKKMGEAAIEIARSKFSFKRRNMKMKEIYCEAMN